MKFYIATSRHEVEKHRRLMDLLVAAGWTCTENWGRQDFLAPLTREAAGTVSVRDALGVSSADILIVLVPGGPGTHVELGMALASDKIVVISSEDRSDEDLLRLGDLFYFYPGIRRHVGSLEELAAAVIKLARLLPRVRSPASGGPRTSVT